MTPDKPPCLFCEKRPAKIIPAQRGMLSEREGPVFCSDKCAARFACANSLHVWDRETKQWEPVA